MEKEEVSFVDDGPEECLLRCAETISGIGEVIIQLGQYEIDLSKDAWAALGYVEEYLGNAVEALGKKYYGAIQDADKDQALIARLRPVPAQLGGGMWRPQRALEVIKEHVAEIDARINRASELTKLKEELLAVKPVILSRMQEEQIREAITTAAAGETGAA